MADLISDTILNNPKYLFVGNNGKKLIVKLYLIIKFLPNLAGFYMYQCILE